MTRPARDPQAGLVARPQFEMLLAEIASRFVNLPPGEVEPAIETAMRQVIDVLDFDRATLWRRGPDQSLYLLRIVQPDGYPVPVTMDAQTHFPWLMGQVLRGEAVLLSSLDDLPPEADVDRASFAPYATLSTGVFPIRVGGDVIGVLSFATMRRRRTWPQETVTRLSLVAQIFGSALAGKAAEESRLANEAALRELGGRLIRAQEQERAWLAKELHDGVNQGLAMLAVELDLLAQRPPAGVPDLRQRLRELSGKAKALSGDVHQLSHGLHPSKLERLGLVAAVGGFCRELNVGGLTVRFTAEGVPRDLPQALTLCAYRLVQEALWNAGRHSRARLVTVELRGGGGALDLQVRDDGQGFDPVALAASDSLGLISMRERAAMVGGEIRWDSRPGAGTTVTARLPLGSGAE